MSNRDEDSQGPSNPAVERLVKFVGQWNIEIPSMSFHVDKTAVMPGRASFEWTKAGAFLFLRQYPEIANSGFTHGTTILGPDNWELDFKET